VAKSPAQSPLFCFPANTASVLECVPDSGEALRLRWIDVTGNAITTNNPINGHLPRQLKVSNRLILMLDSLPKTSDRIFPTSYLVILSCHDKVRKKAAEIQKNSRLLSIELRTYRHEGSSMISHYTYGNVLTVKKL
jgi:integrase